MSDLTTGLNKDHDRRGPAGRSYPSIFNDVIGPVMRGPPARIAPPLCASGGWPGI